MPMNRPFGTDAHGNSPRGIDYIPADEAALAQEAAQRQTLAQMGAAAEARMEAAGADFSLADVETYLHAKGLTTQERMLVKTHMYRSGDTAPKALKHLRLG